MISRLLKFAVSFGVFLLDSLKRLLNLLAGRSPRASCVVLYYHAIKPNQRTGFARQMDELVRLTVPIRADHRNGLAPGFRSSVVTFDDGFVSVMENAVPELRSRNVPATLFIPTGCLGTRPSWIRDQCSPDFDETIVTREQLRQLDAMEQVIIGSHSVDHQNFGTLANDEVASQLRESKRALDEILQQEIVLFSFPHGAYDQRSVDLAKEAGYQRVFTVSPQPAFRTLDEFVTGRVLADPDDWKWEFRLKVLGAYRWMALASKLKRRLFRAKVNRQTP